MGRRVNPSTSLVTLRALMDVANLLAQVVDLEEDVSERRGRRDVLQGVQMALQRRPRG